jgi:hypothetical protein
MNFRKFNPSCYHQWWPLILTAGFLILSVAGCSGAENPSDTAPMPVISTAETVDEIGQPASSEEVIASPALDPSPTAEPPAVTTEPLTPTPQPTTPLTTATPETNIDQGIAAILRAGFQPRIHARYPSPDGTLEAQVLIYDCTAVIEGQENALDILRVVNLNDEESIQEVDSQFQYCGGLGGFGLSGLFWSPSGRYFYYTDAREGGPDGCGFWTRPFRRVDATDWSMEVIGGGPQSTDGNRLAVWNDGDLAIWDIDGEEIGRIEVAMGDQTLGPIAWSPDDRFVAYLQADQFCVPSRSTVVVVDVAGMSPQVLLAGDDPLVQDIAWYGPDQLILSIGEGKYKLLDIVTGELTDRP